MGSLRQYIGLKQRQSKRRSILFAATSGLLALSVLVGVGSSLLHNTYADPQYLWSDTNVNDITSWRSISASDDGTKVIALPSQGNPYVSQDSGQTYSQITTIGSDNWDRVRLSKDGSTIVLSKSTFDAQQGGYITDLHVSRDFGATWTTSNFPTTSISITAMSANGAIIVGTSVDPNDQNNGHIEISTDGGTTWSSAGNSVASDWNSVAISDNGQKLFAVSSSHAISLSNDGGSTWSDILSFTKGNQYDEKALMSANGGRIAYFAQNGGSSQLYISDNNGLNWKETTNNYNFQQSAVMSSDGTKIAVAYGVGIQITVDSGDNWMLADFTGTQYQDPYINEVAMVQNGAKIYAVGAGSYISKGAFNPIPSAPTDVQLSSITKNSMAVSWTAPSNTGGSSITDYKVQLSTDGTNYTDFSHTASTNTNIVVTGLTPQTYYYVRVAAVNSYGASSYSAVNNASTLALSPPGIVNGVTVAPKDSSVLLSWDAPQSGDDITGTKVYYRVAGETAWIQSGSIVPASTTSYTVPNLTNGTIYEFAVQFVNDQFDGVLQVLGGQTHLSDQVNMYNFYSSLASIENGTIFALTSNGIDMTTDNGQTWHTVHTFANNFFIGSAQLSVSNNGQTMIISMTDFANPTKLYISKNGGTTWTTADGAGNHLWMSSYISDDGQDIYAGTYETNDLIVSHDGGTTWSSFAALSNGDLYNGVPYVDGDGNVYINVLNSDYTQGRIVRISPEGSFETFKDGIIAQAIDFSHADQRIISIYTQDDDGNPIQIISYDAGQSWSTYAYDGSGDSTRYQFIGEGTFVSLERGGPTNNAYLIVGSLLRATPSSGDVNGGQGGNTGNGGDTGTSHQTPPVNSSSNTKPAATTNVASENDTVPTQVKSFSINGHIAISRQTISSTPIFSGYTIPGSVVTVTVHSDPKSCTATANSDGYWECHLGDPLPIGEHIVAVAIAHTDGTSEQLGPYSVSVANDTPDTSSTPEKQTATVADQSFPLWVVIAGIGVVLVIIAIIIGVVKSRKPQS